MWNYTYPLPPICPNGVVLNSSGTETALFVERVSSEKTVRNNNIFHCVGTMYVRILQNWCKIWMFTGFKLY